MENMGLKVLVTGATGFIGSNLVNRLLNDGYDVYVLVRPNSLSGMKRLELYKNIKILNIEVERLLEIEELPKFDICFNLASYGVDYRNQDPYEMIDGNIKFVINLIDFCSKNKTNLLVHTGSCFEYGINNNNIPLRENDQLRPHSLYAVSKVSGVIMANTYAKMKSVNLVTVRPFGVYGPNEGIHRLVPQVIDTILQNKKLDMTKGEQVRDYLFVDDLVDAYIKLSTSDKTKIYDIYNICSSEQISIRELVEELCRIYDYDISNFNFGKIPYRENEVMYFVGDNTKIYNDISWKPKTKLVDGLRTTYEWYQSRMEDK